MLSGGKDKRECMSEVHFPPSNALSLLPHKLRLKLLLFSLRCERFRIVPQLHIMTLENKTKKLYFPPQKHISEKIVYANRFCVWKFYSNLIDSDTPRLVKSGHRRNFLVINLSPRQTRGWKFHISAGKLFNYQPWHRNDLQTCTET